MYGQLYDIGYTVEFLPFPSTGSQFNHFTHCPSFIHRGVRLLGARSEVVAGGEEVPQLDAQDGERRRRWQWGIRGGRIVFRERAAVGQHRGERLGRKPKTYRSVPVLHSLGLSQSLSSIGIDPRGS